MALDGLSRRERLTHADDLVFVDDLGGHVDDWRLRRRFEAALEEAGLKRCASTTSGIPSAHWRCRRSR